MAGHCLQDKIIFMEGLKGKNILLVGATGGIGSNTAKLLAGSGANLFLAGRNETKLKIIAHSCGIANERIFVLDITMPNEVEILKEKYFEQFSTIDILVNAAGIGIIKSMDTLSEDEFMSSIYNNLFAPFLLVKAFLPAMKEIKKGLRQLASALFHSILLSAYRLKLEVPKCDDSDCCDCHKDRRGCLTSISIPLRLFVVRNVLDICCDITKDAHCKH